MATFCLRPIEMAAPTMAHAPPTIPLTPTPDTHTATLASPPAVHTIVTMTAGQNSMMKVNAFMVKQIVYSVALAEQMRVFTTTTSKTSREAPPSMNPQNTTTEAKQDDLVQKEATVHLMTTMMAHGEMDLGMT